MIGLKRDRLIRKERRGVYALTVNGIQAAANFLQLQPRQYLKFEEMQAEATTPRGKAYNRGGTGSLGISAVGQDEESGEEEFGLSESEQGGITREGITTTDEIID